MLYVHIKQFIKRNPFRKHVGLKISEFKQKLRDLPLLKDTQFYKNKWSFRHTFFLKVFF